MFRKPDSNSDCREDLLGRALRSIPDPVLSQDFNNHVHRALAEKHHEKRRFWNMLRPGLCAMGGSFAATLALLSAFGGGTHSAITANASKLNLATEQRSGRAEDLDSLIERSDLTSAMIRTLIGPTSVLTPSAERAPVRAPAVKPTTPTILTHVQGA
jgi:hypothetical protein